MIIFIYILKWFVKDIFNYCILLKSLSRNMPKTTHRLEIASNKAYPVQIRLIEMVHLLNMNILNTPR